MGSVGSPTVVVEVRPSPSWGFRCGGGGCSLLACGVPVVAAVAATVVEFIDRVDGGLLACGT